MCPAVSGKEMLGVIINFYTASNEVIDIYYNDTMTHLNALENDFKSHEQLLVNATLEFVNNAKEYEKNRSSKDIEKEWSLMKQYDQSERVTQALSDLLEFIDKVKDLKKSFKDQKAKYDEEFNTLVKMPIKVSSESRNIEDLIPSKF